MEEIIEKEIIDYLFVEKNNKLCFTFGGAIVMTILGFGLVFNWIKGVIWRLK